MADATRAIGLSIQCVDVRRAIQPLDYLKSRPNRV